MTNKKLAHYRSILETRQVELRDALTGRETIAVNSTADMFDQVQNAAERDMAIANLERGSARLREVRDALQRIRLGTFGTCVDCEEEISPKRLDAVPWTPSCFACREAPDRNQTSFDVVAESSLLSVA